MKFVRSSLAVFFAGVMLLNAACADSESKRQEIPRTLGPLTLGMTEEAFTKSTTLKTSACECAKDEYAASIDVAKYPNVFPPYIYSHGGIDAFFYKGKLYKIDLPPEVTDVEKARTKYTNIYGEASRKEDWPNGMSWLTWENNTTAFIVGYERAKGDSKETPKGNATLVRYIDKSLSEALEAQEKKNPSRPRH